MAKYILTVDQGTTGTTVSLMNLKGQMKVKVNQEFTQIFPKPGWVEHDPEEIWASVLKTIRSALAKGKASGKDILTIGITNQRETLVTWDSKTGKTVGNAIVWQCRRTSEICAQMKKKGLEKNVKKITGLVLDPYFSGTKMKWVLGNRRRAKSLAQQGRLRFGTIDSFLVWKLTGGETFATDVSNSSRTLCLDLKTVDYHPEMLKLFKLRREMLPEVRSSAGDFGEVLGVPGLLDGTPISGVIGDQQSALFGQKCFSKGDAKITFGTGSFLLMNTGTRPVVSRKGLLTTLAWKIQGDRSPTYALEGGAFICGAAVQWMRDNMGFVEKAGDIESLAKKVKDTGGVEFVPAFSGLGAPYWNPHVRGTLLGLTRGTNRSHLARATLEAMALQNFDIVETMRLESKAKMETVRVDGGAVKNDLLMQIQADVLGVPVQRPKTIETTSLGAGLMAGLGAGVWSSLQDIQKLDRIEKTFKPKMKALARKTRVTSWRKAVVALEKVYGP